MEPQQVTPTVPPPPVPVEQPWSNKKFKLVLLVVLFILLAVTLAFGYQLIQQKPQDDSNKQGLSDQPIIQPTITPTPTLSIKNNFTLKLPDGLVFNNLLVEDEAGNKIGEALPGVFLLKQNQTCKTFITVDFRGQMSEIVSSKAFSTALYPNGYYTLDRVVLDQQGPPTHALVHSYCLQDTEKAFSIYFYDSEERGKAEFDQILSTFRFVEEVETACGGPVLTPCPSGYFCKTSTVRSGNVEETGGICVKK